MTPTYPATWKQNLSYSGGTGDTGNVNVFTGIAGEKYIINFGLAVYRTDGGPLDQRQANVAAYVGVIGSLKGKYYGQRGNTALSLPFASPFLAGQQSNCNIINSSRNGSIQGLSLGGSSLEFPTQYSLSTSQTDDHTSLNFNDTWSIKFSGVIELNGTESLSLRSSQGNVRLNGVVWRVL